MCLAVPRRVLEIEEGRVLVDWEDGPLWASSAGYSDLAVGEYVLVHAGLVLERVSAEEAEVLLAMQAELAADAFGLQAVTLAGEALR